MAIGLRRRRILRDVFVWLCSAILYAAPTVLRAVSLEGTIAERNEDVKVEAYYYIEYQAAAAGVAELKTQSDIARYDPPSLIPLCSAEAVAGQWLKSQVFKCSEDSAINRIYQTPSLLP